MDGRFPAHLAVVECALDACEVGVKAPLKRERWGQGWGYRAEARARARARVGAKTRARAGAIGLGLGLPSNVHGLLVHNVHYYSRPEARS